jgi:hypothetical protein
VALFFFMARLLTNAAQAINAVDGSGIFYSGKELYE